MGKSMYLSGKYKPTVEDAVHERNGLLSLHICGNSTNIIDKMVLTGADILEIDQKTSLKTAMKAAQGKCALLGQISPTTLMNGSVSEVRIETERMIETIGGREQTGVILGPGCALGGGTPSENIKVLRQAFSN